MRQTLTEAQKIFIELQVRLWQGSDTVHQLPAELIELIFGFGEHQTSSRDSRGNQDFQHNSLFWSGRYLEPEINQWLLRQGDGNKQLLPMWPAGKKFAVCLTHDVDCVTHGFSRQRLRQCKNVLKFFLKNGMENDILFNKFSGIVVNSCARFANPKDSGEIFAPWLAVEAQYGFKSTFFFLPEKVSSFHPFDGPLYRYHEPVKFEGNRLTVAELMQEIERRGWEVGLHGAYYSYDDAEELKREKEQVEVALGKELISVRQHYLHFDITKTPAAQNQAGFKYDSTFGSNRIVGFRNGLAAPFYFYDLAADNPLDLLEIPLHIQENALLGSDNLYLSPALALRRAKEFIEKVEAVKGMITLLWHPNAPGTYPGSFWVYEELLNYLSQRDAWVTSIREIGQWWNLRCRKATSLIDLNDYNQLLHSDTMASIT
jgi:peptidoglycan/xylan/chitin deacetylase (PgdA/CDA1 family)